MQAELAKNVDKQVYANILFEDQYLIKSGGERVMLIISDGTYLW